jgi:nucleotide-binding universal stress UspA family protein
VLPPAEIGEYGAEDEQIAVSPNPYEKRLTEAEEYLQHTTRKFAQDLLGIRVEQEVDTGAAASTIFSIARLEHVDLIVICSHGAHPLFHWIFRSIAREAVHHSPVPILVLREHGGLFLETNQAHHPRVLVTLDGSPLAETALQPALQLLLALADSGSGELHLTQVIDLPSLEGKPLLTAYELNSTYKQAMQDAENYLQGVARRLSGILPVASQVTITCSSQIGDHVSHAITDLVRVREGNEKTPGFDLLAMATHGRTGLQRLRLGSVTEHVLGATDLPLLIVRPSQVAARSQSTGTGR